MSMWLKGFWLVCCVSAALLAQLPTPNPMVRTWTEGMVSPPSTIQDVRWLVGNWNGSLEGGMQEAASFTPTKGHMPGFARGWGHDDAVWFYELNDFVEVEGSLEFHVRHFSGDLTAWEGKDYVRHRLIATIGEILYFDGLTIVREDAGHYTVYVRINDGDRKGQVIVIHQTRTPQL